VEFTDGPNLALVERMPTADVSLPQANYDDGFFNIGVTLTGDDDGRGGLDPFGYPLSFSKLGRMKDQGTLPADFAAFVPELPAIAKNAPRDAVNGSFKAPGLRNVELTGPYFHNGGAATLSQVIEFYTRGGNFPVENRADLDPAIMEIGELQGHPEADAALIAFLQMLTDERVREEAAPFDHPELIVPNGASDADPSQDVEVTIPAVGAAGRTAQGLEPIGPFLPASAGPVVVDDVFSVPGGTVAIPSVNYLDVLANDGDLDGQEIEVVSVTQGANGAVSIGQDALSVEYRPTAGFTGFDSFTYTVSDGGLSATASVNLTVWPGNRPPEARLDFFFTVPVDSVQAAVAVLINDFDIDGNPLAIVDVVQPAEGTAAIDPVKDQILFTPDPGFAGFVNLLYTISDGALTSSNIATVKVNSWPVAQDDALSVPAHSTNNALPVLNNDSDPDPGDVLGVIAVNQPLKGTAVIDPTDAHIVYTPRPGAIGTDRLVYFVSDGVVADFATVTITITPNSPPTLVADTFTVQRNSSGNSLGVLANDSDPDGDAMAIVSVTQPANGTASIGTGGNVLYTPAAGFTGTSTFTYTVRDAKGAESTADVTVAVTSNLPNKAYIPLAVRGP
jgi:hypothetical protein